MRCFSLHLLLLITLYLLYNRARDGGGGSSCEAHRASGMWQNDMAKHDNKTKRQNNIGGK